ncbi:MAG: PP2C family protein-serine/threonine phosphatase [Acidobacteria bacterium]|nr:PP2C family protein-serine/threonine phosphatase [Acidobacteriota bacterium]
MTSSASQSEAQRLQEAEAAHLRPAYLTALVEASKILNSTLDLDHLLELILQVATKELGADRGTVWLLYPKEGELRARISQGLESRTLRLKIGQGLAGKVAETGETIRIEDAYNDPRFYQRMDAASGYRTRSMLCSAIRNKTGEIIGVIQLLNKVEGTFVLEDEVFLQALTVHFALALENAKLHAALIHQQRIRTELELARQIQQNLLRPPPERWHNYRLAASAEACYEVGGDLYDFMPISDTAMWAVIADVSGKGISSALVMSTLQATLHALLVGVHSFERILERLNSMVREFTGGNHYVTLFLALLDSESRRIHYINAGHNPPLLVHASGKVDQLEEGGTVVGLIPNVRYSRAHAELAPGDVLVLYTDGLAEAANAAGEMFGTEGIEKAVAAANPDTNPATVLQSILTNVHEFSAGEPQGDDQTVVVIAPEAY